MATNDKYDRQLRLWGAAGQRALAETCVVLIRATAAGTETVKNLVLPGIGAVYVVDDEAARDATSNFFVVTNSSSSSTPNDEDDATTATRAEVALTLLRELNPDVHGSWKHSPVPLLDLDWNPILHDAQTRWARYGITKLLVVTSDLEPPLQCRVASACCAQQQQVPLVAVHAYGLLGVVRLQTPPLALLEPRPRDAPPDLRLAQPFPRLVALANEIVPHDTWQTSALSDYEHGHVPYPFLLLRLAQDWKDQHQGRCPQTWLEKQEFQATIRAAARNYDMQLNFQEAVQYAYLAYSQPQSLDPERWTQLQRQAASAGCHVLDILLRALQQFLLNNSEGQPPLNGSLPDMTSSTDWYVRLQTVYREQAADHVAEMKRLVQQQQQVQQQCSSTEAAVSDEQVTAFCKNVFSVDLFQTRSIVDEYNYNNVTDELCEELQSATMEGDERPDQLPLLWYLGFRACQDFFVQHGRYPGTFNDDEDDEEESLANDAALLQQCLVDVVAAYRLTDNELIQSTLLAHDVVVPESEDDTGRGGGYSKYAVELTRYGNAELHTIASVVGGVASQEAVKIVTGQYVPIRGTYIYNGIASMGAVYQF
jgi:amyloid beta precursor protein binding protein 1